MIPDKMDFVGGSRQLYDRVKAVEKKLQTIPASKDTCRRLFQELGETTEVLHALKQKASSVFAKSQLGALEELDETIKTLYGNIVDQHVNQRVTHIVQDTDAALAGNINRLTIKKLKRRIDLLLHEHRLSIYNRKLVASAESNLEKAEAQLEGKPIRHFDLLSQEKNVHFVEVDSERVEEIAELYEIGRALYERRFSDGKKQFRSLSYNLQERCTEHVRSLAATLFVDVTQTIQALLILANELAGNGEGCPNASAIDEIFLGVRQVIDEH
jgi:hypothetical protein